MLRINEFSSRDKKNQCFPNGKGVLYENWSPY